MELLGKRKYVSNFGKIIRKKRIERDITQEYLEQITGIKYQNIGKLEKQEDPKYSTMKMFAHIYNLVFTILPGLDEPIKVLDADISDPVVPTVFDKNMQAFVLNPKNKPWIQWVMACAESGRKSIAVEMLADLLNLDELTEKK